MDLYFFYNIEKIDDFNKMWNNFSTKNERNNFKSILGKENNDTKLVNPENKMEKSPSFFSKLFSWLKK